MFYFISPFLVFDRVIFDYIGIYRYAYALEDIKYSPEMKYYHILI